MIGVSGWMVRLVGLSSVLCRWSTIPILKDMPVVDVLGFTGLGKAHSCGWPEWSPRHEDAVSRLNDAGEREGR